MGPEEFLAAAGSGPPCVPVLPSTPCVALPAGRSALSASGAVRVDGVGPPDGLVWDWTVPEAAIRPTASKAILMVLMRSSQWWWVMERRCLLYRRRPHRATALSRR